jgi:hypothetical protein
LGWLQGGYGRGIGDEASFRPISPQNSEIQKRHALPANFILWVDNIKMDLLELGWGGVDWIGLAQDRDKWRSLVNAVMNLRVL